MVSIPEDPSVKGVDIMLNLNGLKHSRVTNLKEGRISNQDVVLLGIADGKTGPEIRQILKGWRTDMKKWGPSHLVWYFAHGECPRLEMPRKPTWWKDCEVWYRRVGRGRYELTDAGKNRVISILNK